ncbi:MAG: CHAT domain-containing tetratricopeptide repeat protein [Bacteroidales bacterium]
MGRFQMMLNSTAKAVTYLKRALVKSLNVNGQNHYQTGLCYFHLGECYHILGIRDSAKICYNEATQVLSPSTLNVVLRKTEVLPQYETVLIECWMKQGEFYSERSETLLLALEKYSAAINRLLFLSHAITAESTRFIIAEKGRSAFNKGIACALQLFEQTKDNNYLDQAFEWSLQAKSLSLNWLVEKDLIYARVGIPSELTEKLQAYRKNLDELLGDSLDFVVHVPLDSIGRVIRLYEETEKQIRIKYDEIRKGIATDPISRRITGKNFNKERYLGYYDLDSLIIVFGVTSKGRSYIRIPKDSLLITQINRFKEILSYPPHSVYGSKEVSEFSHLSFSLYEKLVWPALNGSERDHLAIYPDGILLGFPFEALTTSKVISDTYKGLPFLMNRFQIRYLSTSLLIGPKHRHDFIRDAISIITCKDAANIPDVATEVTGIAEMYRHPSIWYLDQEQSNTLLNDTSLVIHISSHLSVNTQDPLKSGIFCQKSGVSGLTFKEILNYQLSGSQVFINACESGNGPVNHGEGLMSLGLAFSIAGCSTIVQQVWKAPDHSSALIAQSYYEFLGKSGPADAITRAKKEYLRSAKPGSDHPYYWAGMVCYSNISGKTCSPQLLIPILIVIMLGVSVYWFLRKRN